MYMYEERSGSAAASFLARSVMMSQTGSPLYTPSGPHS